MNDPVIIRMREWFDKLDSDFDVPSEVDKFLAREAEQHAAELADLARAMVRSYVVETAGAYLRRIRTQSRKSALREQLRDRVEHAAEEIAAGTHTLLDDQYVVNDEGLRRFAGDMTGQDHQYVAAQYDNTAAKAKLLAAFHRAVAIKVGSKRTSDVFSPDRYAELYRSIAGPPTPGKTRDAA